MSSSVLSKIVMRAFRHDAMSSVPLTAWKRQSLNVYETHQRAFEVILELPILKTTLEGLSSTKNRNNVIAVLTKNRNNMIAELKSNLAFVPDTLPTYLPALQAWCHSFREFDEHTLGHALSRSEITYINKMCGTIMKFVVKANNHLGDLKFLMWLDSRTEENEQCFLKHSLDVNKAVRNLFYCVNDLYERLSPTVRNTALLRCVQFKDITETYKCFWEVCLESLDGLRLLGKDWGGLHERLSLWVSGLFEGPVALDEYLRWPESHTTDMKDSKQEIILNGFACILHYCGEYFVEQSDAIYRLICCLEIELKLLRTRRDIPDILRTHFQLLHARTRAALVKEDLFPRAMVLWSTDMFQCISDKWDIEANENVTPDPVVLLEQAMHTLEKLGKALVKERPRALAEHEARVAVMKMQAASTTNKAKEPSVVPILPLRAMATTATTQGQYPRACRDQESREDTRFPVQKALTHTVDRRTPQQDKQTPIKSR